MAANSNSRIEARLNSTLKELEAVSRQRDDALKANTTLQTEMSQFRKKSDRNDEVCENMRAVERQKEELEWRLKELQQQNKELHNEVEEVKQVATGLRDEVRRVGEKDEQLQARLEESCRCVEDQRKSVALVTKEREELDRAINVKEELSSSSSLGWTQPSQQSMQRGNSHVCGESSQLHGDAAASEGIRRCEESVVPKCPIQCSSLGCTQVPQHARSIQRGNSFVSQVSVLKCDGLRSEEEELGVQSIAQQTAGIKALEERKKGPEKEGNGFLEQSKDFHPQLPKASNNHTSHVPMMSEQLTVNGSADIEKEREKLLQENEMLKAEKTSLQSIVAKLQQERSHEETNQWREKYEQLIIDMETAKETESRRVKQLESQLYSSQEASRGVAELKGTLIEQDTRLQEYYTHMEEQEKTLASMQGLEVELKRANEENNQLKAEIEGYTNSQKKHAEQQESYCRDLALRTGEVKEAQRQYAECYRRLQQVEGELASVKNKLKEESEKLQAQCTTHYSLATWYRDAQAQIKVLEEEKARLMQHKGGLQKEYEQLNSRLVIMAKQLKVYESERDHVLSEANTQKQSLQKEINSLTAKSQESQEAMRKMASELEMASRRENKEHSRSLQLEAELKRCYKHIEGQKKALVEEKFKNQMELMNRRIAVLEKDKELVANGGPIHFQRSISQRVPQEHLPPHPPRLSHTSPQPMAPEDQGVCPICG